MQTASVTVNQLLILGDLLWYVYLLLFNSIKMSKKHKSTSPTAAPVKRHQNAVTIEDKLDIINLL
jgi:hypothetical protein